ncbi:MAG: DUF2191 domain-containing protein [Candidatus Solibacter usitatus]|nr:DUF2191 domain-containing protein [Candidatus Solibacter usitatus]
MRTTVRLPPAIMERARREAARRGTTFTALIEQGLQLALAAPPPQSRRVRLPISRARGGTLPGVDLDNTAALLDIMDGRT